MLGRGHGPFMLLGRIEKYGHVSINKVLSQHLTHLVLWRCGAVTPESAKDCCCANNPGHISHTVLHTHYSIRAGMADWPMRRHDTSHTVHKTSEMVVEAKTRRSQWCKNNKHLFLCAPPQKMVDAITVL
jgi:hypothetical protein